jgi:hypothetical protein
MATYHLGMPVLMPKTATSKGSTTRRIALLIVFVALSVIGYFGFKTIRGLMMLGYVDSAIGRMRVLYAAENQFAKEHPARGYTCELSELPQSSDIRRLLAKNSIDNGYTFEIEGCHAPVRQKPILTYYITARPLHTGQPAFCSDQSGILRTDYGGSVEKCQSNGVPL